LPLGGKFELRDVVETHHRVVTNAAPGIRV
jgi:hypothetical protein